MKKKVVEVVIGDDGTTVKVHVKELSWKKAQTVIGQSMTIDITGQSRIDLEKLRVNLTKYAIEKIEGYDGPVDKFLDEIPVSEGNKIFKAVIELNPLEQILM